jgi:rhamnosyltransferase
MTTRKVSVVIRTRDEENGFERLMENLAMQNVQPSELIIVDNYSTNAKLHGLRRKIDAIRKLFQEDCKFRIIPIPDREFSHASSTNLGVKNATNELVCITNAHSLPVSLHWLEDGLKHFEDPKVAGVSGFFIPHQKDILGKWITPMYHISERKILRQNWLSTINCIIRKSLWKTYPFNENLPKSVPETKRYGLEDYDWSQEMTARGFKIIIDPSFSVFHSHEKGFKEIIRHTKNFFVFRRIQTKMNVAKRKDRATPRH